MVSDFCRWCVFCGADCHASEPEHSAECPSSTGVFPAEHLRLPNQGEIDAFCTDCGEPFEPGESYTHRWIEPDVGEVICLGCAAAEQLR